MVKMFFSIFGQTQTRVFECFSEVLYCFCHLGTLYWRALLQVCGLGTPVPTDCSTGDVRPSAVRPRVSSPRGLIAGSREEKKHFKIFYNTYSYVYINIIIRFLFLLHRFLSEKKNRKIFSPATRHGALFLEGRHGYQIKERQPRPAEQATRSGAPAHNTETALLRRVNHPTERTRLCWTVRLLSLHLQPEPPTGAAALMTGWGRLTSMH